jgi:DMSO/TMAO reductase YedYZ heme-binding membrane subunit
MFFAMPHEIHFQQKLEAQLKKRPNIPAHHLWRDIIIYSLFILIITCLYYFAQRGRFSFSTLNSAFGDVSILLIGLSFALSGICYYWNFADHFIIYRKQLGVVGFSYAMIHGLISLFFLEEARPILLYYLQSENVLAFTSAVVALLIYAGMVIVSTKYVIHQIGGAMWRKLLRVGYIAYFLSVLHFGLQSYPYWVRWLSGKSTNMLPSFGLITFLFGVAVLFLRIFLWFSLLKKPAIVTQQPDGQPNSEPLQKT